MSGGLDRKHSINSQTSKQSSALEGPFQRDPTLQGTVLREQSACFLIAEAVCVQGKRVKLTSDWYRRRTCREGPEPPEPFLNEHILLPGCGAPAFPSPVTGCSF